jgi:hypothetical protein
MPTPHPTSESGQAATDWLPRVTTGRIVGGVPQRIPVMLLLFFVVLLGPALASGSPVDPTWIAGFWDAADHDEDLLAATGLEGIGDHGGPPLLVSDLPVVGPVRLVAPAVSEAAPSTRPAIRAPPAA